MCCFLFRYIYYFIIPITTTTCKILIGVRFTVLILVVPFGPRLLAEIPLHISKVKLRLPRSYHDESVSLL